MSGLRISVDVAGLPVGGAITAELFPNLADAVHAVADRALEIWTDYAAGGAMPDGSRINDRTGQYLRSIHMRKTGDFSAEVYTELPYAKAIEEGTGPRDMKDILHSSMKVRISKKGKRYLIIPFRWNSPKSVLGNNAPVQVWNWWKDRGSSYVASQHTRVSGTGAFDIKTRAPLLTPAWKYRWGSRLTPTALANLGFKDNDPLARRMAGMVRFRTPGKTGGGSHTQLITFRVMSEGSKGWIRPAQPGKWPARTTADQLRPAAEQEFKAAVERDVAAMLEGELGT